MGYATRVTTWSAGDTLTASALNAEFNIAINALSDGTKDANVSALAVNSTLAVTGISTLTANVAMNANATVTGNLTAGNLTASGALTSNTAIITNSYRIGDIYNLGITLSGGLLSLTDASGAALSTTNFGTVTMPGATAGTTQNIKLTANMSLRDDANATSDLSSLGFGITEAAHWAQDVPFFIYVVNKGGNAVTDTNGNSAICLSRNPVMTTTPASANNIARRDGPGTLTTDDQTSIILWGSNYTTSGYTSLPVQLIGVVRMQWTTTGDDWTVQTLGVKDGIGAERIRNMLSTQWTMPAGQNGASASTYLLPNGGTAPVFSTNVYTYSLKPDGFCDIYFDLRDDGGANGSGSVDAQLALPYAASSAIASGVRGGSVFMRIDPLNPLDVPGQLECVAGSAYAVLYRILGSSDAEAVVQLGATFVDERKLMGTYRFKAF